MGFKKELKGYSGLLEPAWQELQSKTCTYSFAMLLQHCIDCQNRDENLTDALVHLNKKQGTRQLFFQSTQQIALFYIFTVAIHLQFYYAELKNPQLLNQEHYKGNRHFNLQPSHSEEVLQEEPSKCTRPFVFTKSMRNLLTAPDQGNNYSFPSTRMVHQLSPFFSFKSRVYFKKQNSLPFPLLLSFLLSCTLFPFFCPIPSFNPSLLHCNPSHSAISSPTEHTLRPCGPTPPLWVAGQVITE